VPLRVGLRSSVFFDVRLNGFFPPLRGAFERDLVPGAPLVPPALGLGFDRPFPRGGSSRRALLRFGAGRPVALRGRGGFRS
jgi:hypothetical protein